MSLYLWGGVLRSEGLGEYIEAAHKGGDWVDFVGVRVVVIIACVGGAVILSGVVCVAVFVGVAEAGTIAVAKSVAGAGAVGAVFCLCLCFPYRLHIACRCGGDVLVDVVVFVVVIGVLLCKDS